MGRGGAGSRRTTMLVALGVLALEASVFVVDLRTPRGVVEWLFYLPPVLLCLFAREGWVPLATAAVSTLLMASGFELGAEGVNDEVGRLNREIGAGMIWLVAIITWRLIVSRSRVEIDAWTKEGKARLSTVVRDQTDTGELATRVLAEVCRWLGAQSGALFAAREGEAYELAGGYAISPARAKIRPRFELGEGLVGQVARSEEVLRLVDVPKGYAELASGLGEAPLRELLLAPLTARGRVVGVIEIGFTSASSALHVDYLERVGDTIGAALQSVHDQSELHELLERLRRQAEELEANNAELGRVMAIVSHDLRTPLFAVTLTAEMLAARDLAPDAAADVARIRRSASRMVKMIEELLDFSRLRQGGGLLVQRTASDLVELARAVVAEIQIANPDRAIELHADGSAPGLWDDRAVSQAISNLVANAVQHGRGQRIWVDVGMRGPRGVVEVRNQGEPIPPDLLPHLFEPFRAGASGAPRTPKGLGLGLYIVREIARAHGGGVDVRSTPQDGTCFTLTLAPS